MSSDPSHNQGQGRMLTVPWAIYENGYRCLDCYNFNYCAECMDDLSILHKTHRFLSFQDRIYDNIIPRKSHSLAEKAQDLSTEEYEDQITYSLKTIYRYEYKDIDAGTIGFLQFNTPRISLTTKQRKSMCTGSTPEIPVVERLCIIQTTYKARSQISKAELQAIDTTNGSILITINSPYILNVLRAIVDYFPGRNLSDNTLQSLKFPYSVLSCHRTQLMEYKAHHSELHDSKYIKECNSHIDEVVRFLDQEFQELHEEQRRWSQGEPTISFDKLWLLFKPGQTLYARGGGCLHPYICCARNDRVDYTKGGKDYVVVGWNIDFDGITFGRSLRAFSIPKFSGEMNITALKVFPTSFYDEEENEDTLHRRLIASGKKFFNVSKKPCYLEYTGVTINAPKQKVCHSFNHCIRDSCAVMSKVLDIS